MQSAQWIHSPDLGRESLFHFFHTVTCTAYCIDTHINQQLARCCDFSSEKLATQVKKVTTPIYRDKSFQETYN